jgi:hypothetical protein
MLARELFRAATWRFMPFAQKIAYSVIDMTINSLIRRRKRAMAEVSRPTAQKAIESRTNLRPCAFVARYQQVADFRLDPLHAFLGRRRAQIPTTTVGEVAWSERIAKEIEAFPPSSTPNPAAIASAITTRATARGNRKDTRPMRSIPSARACSAFSAPPTLSCPDPALDFSTSTSIGGCSASSRRKGFT